MHHWHGFWHFGDLRHYFQGGYGWIATPEDLVGALAGPAGKRTSLSERKRVRDYFPPNDWAYDNGRWGWSNTEGLPNLFLLHEYLRHGNRSVYFATEALARHSRDVVTRQEGMWLGRGTRHGVQHWSDGNHDERQTTVTEYRVHHLLSGDARTRDVINHLYREVYSQRPLHAASWHSGRLGVPVGLRHGYVIGKRSDGTALGDTNAWTMATGKATVEFRVRCEADFPDVEVFRLLLSDGTQFWSVTFYPNRVASKEIDATQMKTYRATVDEGKLVLSTEANGVIYTRASGNPSTELAQSVMIGFGTLHSNSKSSHSGNGMVRWELEFIRWTNQIAMPPLGE